MWLLNIIMDICFPIYCISCQKKGEEFCLNCISKLPQAERETFKWIHPSYDYRHPSIKKALWLLKYSAKKRLSKTFAVMLYERILEELADLTIMENFQKPILIPIPISKQRHRERGYNQTELICRELIKLDKNQNFELENNLLIKIHETVHQARIKDRRERLKNLAGSFTIKNNTKIKNRNIILIDDITTTGATLNEAKKTLKIAGARKIVAFTVAH